MAAGSVTVFLAATVLYLIGGTPAPIDAAAKAYVDARPTLEPAGVWVSEWSLKIAQPLILVCLIVLLVRRQWIPPAAMLGAFAVGDLIVSALKWAFGRARPDGAIANGLAFPSAHATGASHQWAYFFLLALPLVLRRKAPEWWEWLLWIVIATITGLARVAEGEHWLTDVVAGLALGSLMSAGVAWASLRDWRAKARTPAPDGPQASSDS